MHANSILLYSEVRFKKLQMLEKGNQTNPQLPTQTLSSKLLGDAVPPNYFEYHCSYV